MITETRPEGVGERIRRLGSWRVTGCTNQVKKIPCRKGCGACCIAPMISSSLPGLPKGKPAGLRCIHLTQDYLCSIYNNPERPKVCRFFEASEELCGNCRSEAMDRLSRLESMTEGPTGP
jgi:Fe-S-cluster containining protein